MASMPSTSGQPHDRFDNHGVTLGEPDPAEIPISLYQKMMSATTGSIITSLLVTPLDVVRVRLQSQPTISSKPTIPNIPQPYTFTNVPPSLGVSSCCREVFWISNSTEYCVASSSIALPANTPNKSVAACAVEETQRRNFNSTWDGLRKIARNEGPSTLWRGLTPTLLMAIPANVIYFAYYDVLRYSARSPFKQSWISDTYVPLLAGSSARIVSAIVVSPIEMFRTRMQAAHNNGGSGNITETFQGLKNLVGARGFRGLWSGLGLTLWRDVPFSAIYWWGYEDIRERIRNYRGRKESPGSQRRKSFSSEKHSQTLIDSFAAGATSGAVAAFITTPFDVGKTRQQVVRHSNPNVNVNNINGSSSVKKLPEELSMPRFLWHIFKTQGTAGLFKGWAARCLKVAPACAIMISSYEIGKKLAVDINVRKDVPT